MNLIRSDRHILMYVYTKYLTKIITHPSNMVKHHTEQKNAYMKGLQPERYYRILFKHINNDGTVIYDDNHHFKVTR